MSRSTYLTPKRSNCRSVTWKFQPRKPRKQHRHNRTPAVNARINVRHEESIPQLCLAAVECQSNRAINDEILLDHIKRVHRDNYSCYGVRKVWYSLLDDVEVLIKPGRDQVARLMRRAGLRGIRRLKRVITTVSDPEAPKSEDMVKREWDQGAPDRVWVADFTEVRSREGVVYVAFVQDAGTRNILGFNVRTSRPAELVETALEQAVNTKIGRAH